MGCLKSKGKKEHETDLLSLDQIEEIDDIRRKYQNFHLLGDGGSSNVFWVRDVNTKVKFALKKMSKRSNVIKQMFLSEVTILGMLEHRNIISLEGAYADDRSYYVVTELARGGDLLDHIKNKYTGDKKENFTEKYVASLIVQILNVVSYCHSMDVAHRDIKPENFVFRSKVVDSPLLLIDFGIATLLKESQTYTDLAGTPYYLAPEYLSQHERTTQQMKSADIWSVGIVAYVLCTGRPPFHGSTNDDIFRKIVYKPVKFPKRAKLSPLGKSFLKLILTKDPDKRPSGEVLLNHEWLESASNQSLDVADNIVSFSVLCKLRKVIQDVIKKHVDTKLVDNVSAIFEEVDENGDGNISQAEMENFLIKSGFPNCQVADKAKEIMETVDTDGDGNVNVKEFEQAWAGFQLSKDEKLVAALFNVFDANGDGVICKTELKAILGDDSTTGCIKDLFGFFDANGDGDVNYKEFAKTLEKIGLIEKQSNKKECHMTTKAKNLLFNIDVFDGHDESGDVILDGTGMVERKKTETSEGEPAEK